MKPETVSFTKISRATNRPFTTRRVVTRGLRCSSSPASLQRKPCGTSNHTSAANVQKKPQRSVTQASVAEAPTKTTAVDTQHADKAAKSISNHAKSQQPPSSASQQSQLESFGLLEWPELCQQVSKWLGMFCMVVPVMLCLDTRLLSPATCLVVM